MDHPTHRCPLCGTRRFHTEPYARSVCADCTVRACDSTGRRIVGSNLSFSGGFVARYPDAASKGEDICSEVTDSGNCWIDGVACTIGEDRFGGVVVQA